MTKVISILALLLFAGPAFAITGATPLSVENGVIDLNCADDTAQVISNQPTGTAPNQVKSMACTDYLPYGVAVGHPLITNSLWYSLSGSIAKYDPVACSGGIPTALATSSNQELFCGCAFTAQSTFTGQVKLFSLASYMQCFKDTSTAVSSGERLKLNASGKMVPAADNEEAIGVAAAGYGSSVSVINVLPFNLAAKQAVTASIVQRVGNNRDSLPNTQTTRYLAMDPNTYTSSSSFELVRGGSPWFSSNITVGLSCTCNSAPASSRSRVFTLQKGTSTPATDLSTCTITAGNTTCSDSSFSGPKAVSDSEFLTLKVDGAGGGSVGCQYIQCKFTYQ